MINIRSTKTKTMKTLTITVKAVQTRFAIVFLATNDYGEPKGGDVKASDLCKGTFKSACTAAGIQ